MTKGRFSEEPSEKNGNRKIAERQRRDKIGSLLGDLKELIPKQYFRQQKPQIQEVLQASVDLITDLLTKVENCRTKHSKELISVESVYYKSQNHQLRKLLRHAGLSEVQEFQLIAALSEETIKTVVTDLDSGLSAFENNTERDHSSSTFCALDLTANKETSDLARRPGNVISLLKRNSNDETSEADNISAGIKETVDPPLKEVSSEIKNAIRDRMIEIVYNSSSHDSGHNIRPHNDTSKSRENSTTHKPVNFSKKSVDLTSITKIKIGSQTIHLIPVSKQSPFASQSNSEAEGNDSNLPTATGVSRDIEEATYETAKSQICEVSTENNSNGNGHNSPSENSESRQDLSLLSIANLGENSKIPSIEEINTQLQEDASMENAIRSSTLFDIDSLIANAGSEYSNQFTNCSVANVPVDQRILATPASASSAFSIRHLTNEPRRPCSIGPDANPESQPSSVRLTGMDSIVDAAPGDGSDISHPNISENTINYAKSSANQKFLKNSTDSSNSSKANSHSVEAIIMSSTNSDSINLSKNRDKHQSIYVAEKQMSYNSEENPRKRVVVSAADESPNPRKSSQSSNNSTFYLSSKKSRLSNDSSDQFNIVSMATTSFSAPSQSSSDRHAQNSMSTPLPFWEENMVVMPPQSFPFQSPQNTQLPPSYPAACQNYLEGIPQYHASYYGANTSGPNYNNFGSVEAPSMDYPAAIGSYRPAQNLMFPPPSFPTNYAQGDGPDSTGKYFSNLGQPFVASLQYNGNSAQQSLEPQMLLQPLGPNERWDRPRPQNGAYSGFKDVEFMASNNTISHFSATSNSHNMFTPFLDGNTNNASQVGLATDQMQYSNGVHYFPQHSLDKRNATGNRATTVDKGHRHPNNVVACSRANAPLKHSTSSSLPVQQQQQQQQAPPPRHLIKNFVHSKSINQNSADKQSVSASKMQQSVLTSNHLSKSAPNEFHWSPVNHSNNEIFMAAAVPSSNFLFASSESPFS